MTRKRRFQVDARVVLFGNAVTKQLDALFCLETPLQSNWTRCFVWKRRLVVNRPAGRCITRFAESRNLLLDVFLEHLAADDGAVDVSIRVHSYAFGSAVVDGGRFHIFDKVFDRAVFGAADADTFFPAGLVRPPRLRVCDIHRVVLGDEDPAWPRELTPGVEVAAILVEDLDAIIGAVADK